MKCENMSHRLLIDYIDSLRINDYDYIGRAVVSFFNANKEDLYAAAPEIDDLKIELSPDTCTNCMGCGNIMVSHANQCHVCGGSGKIPKGDASELGYKVYNTTSNNDESVLSS